MASLDIVIVEDESIIRKGLEKAISHMDGNFRIVGSFDDGESALDFIGGANALPDLVLTDIYMKRLDGLELIERLKDISPGMKSVILTGHEDFRLAKQAIDLKVQRYLLKPVELSELHQVLKNVAEEVGQDRQNKQLHKISADHIRDKLLADLLADRLSSIEELKRFKHLLPYPFAGTYLGGAIRLFKGRTSTRDTFLYGMAVKQLLTETVLDRNGFAIEKEPGLLAFGISAGEQPISGIQEAIARFPSQSESVLAIPVAAAVGEPAEGLAFVKKSVRQALLKLEETERGLRKCPQDKSLSSKEGVRIVQTYLQEHYGDSTISLQQLAEFAAIHPNYLTQTFRKQTGLSCMQYLAHLRMEKAKELLRETDLKIHEVASRVGYENPLYFSNYFKKWVGVYPSEYKEGTNAYA